MINEGNLFEHSPLSEKINWWSIPYNERDVWSESALYAWEKFSNVADKFRRDVGILVNWYISAGVLTMIAWAIVVKTPVEMWWFTRIPMICLNDSFMLLNFCPSKKKDPAPWNSSASNMRRSGLRFLFKLAGMWVC